MTDKVKHPLHYTSHASGVECIEITEHLNFCLGNAIKYIWRCGLKGDEVEDLEKAKWYIEREIARRRQEAVRITEALQQGLENLPELDLIEALPDLPPDLESDPEPFI